MARSVAILSPCRATIGDAQQLEQIVAAVALFDEQLEQKAERLSMLRCKPDHSLDSLRDMYWCDGVTEVVLRGLDLSELARYRDQVFEAKKTAASVEKDQKPIKSQEQQRQKKRDQGMEL